MFIFKIFKRRGGFVYVSVVNCWEVIVRDWVLRVGMLYLRKIVVL